MVATDPRHSAGPAPRRRFITRQQVEDAARSGNPVVASGRDVVTDEAAQRAEDLGVRIEREKPAGTTPRAAASQPAGAPPTDEAVRRAVHAAVVAELGRAPDGLAAVIDRVMTRRGR
jgi:hypothetical protein